MHIGICYTKNGPNGIACCEAFSTGVHYYGDGFIPFLKFNKKEAFECDVMMMVCGPPTEIHPKNFNFQVKQYCAQTNTPLVIIDTGFVQPDFISDNANDRYMSVGLNNIKGGGFYGNINSPSDRWDKLKIELKPWRTEGSHVLVIGQGVQNKLNHQQIWVHNWFNEILDNLPQYTKRPIRFRPHPLWLKNKGLKPERTLEEDLKDAWCVMGLTSSGIVDGIIRGIPGITWSTWNIAFSVSEHFLENIENPKMPDRLQWCYNLAYAQWSVKEIGEGLSWEHLKSHIEKFLKYGKIM